MVLSGRSPSRLSLVLSRGSSSDRSSATAEGVGSSEQAREEPECRFSFYSPPLVGVHGGPAPAKLLRLLLLLRLAAPNSPGTPSDLKGSNAPAKFNI